MVMWLLLILLFALKIEDHFSYFKILFPEMFDGHGSFMQSRRNNKFVDPNITSAIFLPFFKRKTKAEENNWELKRLGEKVEKRCKQIWVVGLIAIVLSIINVTNHFA